MKTLIHYKLFLITFSFIFFQAVYADNLGRIFTTANERQKLEQIKLKKKQTEKPQVTEVQTNEVVTKKETIIREPITLKGLVHRNGGKSTAWINDRNTFEDDLDPQFIQIPDNKIESDQVTIIMPDDSNPVKLRVGETYTPKPIEKETDITVDTKDN